MSKGYDDYLVYGLVAVVIGVVVYLLIGLGMPSASSGITDIVGTNLNKPISNIPQNTGQFETITTGSTNPGEVEIGLTPHKVINGKLNVDIAANTHSVDLSPFDLTKIITLEYDGKKINPIEAPQLGGHHASGTLVFNVDQEVKSFIITIIGIPKVEKRLFKW